MSDDLSEKEIVDFIRGDFEAAWDALASIPGPLHRGNFLFARQAMTLLEVACRLCASDVTGSALAEFAQQLERCDKRYFTRLPGPCWAPSKRTRGEFSLPSRGPDPDNQVIAAVFNLVRNGQAHQYQQMRAVLDGGKLLRFSLTGAEHGLYLRNVFISGRPADHVRAASDANGNIWITLRPDVLFLNLCQSIDKANLLGRGLKLQFIAEDRKNTFTFDAPTLEGQLRGGGHWT